MTIIYTLWYLISLYVLLCTTQELTPIVTIRDSSTQSLHGKIAGTKLTRVRVSNTTLQTPVTEYRTEVLLSMNIHPGYERTTPPFPLNLSPLDCTYNYSSQSSTRVGIHYNETLRVQIPSFSYNLRRNEFIKIISAKGVTIG